MKLRARQFLARVREARRSNKAYILIPAWHGFSEANVDSITEHGLQPIGASGLNGRAIYLSCSARVSGLEYSEALPVRCMFLTLALIGESPLMGKDFKVEDSELPLLLNGKMVATSLRTNGSTVNVAVTCPDQVVSVLKVSFTVPVE